MSVQSPAESPLAPPLMWRWRWTVVWALLAGSAAAAAGLLAMRPLESRHRQELIRLLDAEEQRLNHRINAEAGRLQRDRERFHEVLVSSGRALLLNLTTHSTGVVEGPMIASADSWASWLDIDRWAIVDDTGTVRAGDTRLAVAPGEDDRIATGAASAWRIRPGGLFLEAEAPLNTPAGMRIRVGRRLDNNHIELWNVVGGFAWLSRSGRMLARNAAAARIDADQLRLATSGTEDRTLRARTGDLWHGRTLSESAGVRWIGVPRVALDAAAAAERRRVFVGAALAALIAAFLAWPLSSLWARPITALFSAVERIVRGEADYGGLPARRDEFAAVTDWVSRLRRTLDRQRLRTRAAEKGAAWREVARQVAHDVKNPLAPIRLTIQNLQRARLQTPERFGPDFDREAPRVLEEVARLQRLVDAFARFAELPEAQPRRFNPLRLMEEVAGLASGRDNISTRILSAKEPLYVLADPDLVRQILHNLVSNAQQAMAAVHAEGEVRLSCGEHSGQVALVVEDDGPGFGEEARHRAGTPGFTTRPDGSGLGLAISHRLAESQGGQLEIGEAPGGGARVCLLLPVASGRDEDGEPGEGGGR